MGRKRAALGKQWEKAQFVVRFLHPLQNKTMHVGLGADPREADEVLAELNAVFLQPAYWRDPPPGKMREWLRLRWLGGKQKTKPPPESDASAAAVQLALEVRYWRDLYEGAETRAAHAEKTLRVIHKQKIRTGPSPTLDAALATWLADFKGRDPDYMYNVERDLTRFVERFGASREVDSFIGAELEIKNDLMKLGVSPSTRNAVRKCVLRFLEDSGATLDRKLVPAAGARAVRAARGAIRWLERPQATALAKKLPPYWADLFRVNVQLGLRPEEMPTLHADNFTNNFKLLTLMPREHLTLKTGSRKIAVPAAVRKIIKRRLKNNASGIVFPQMVFRIAGNKKVNVLRDTGRLWKTMDWFDRKYVRELRAAAKLVNADEKLPATARIGVKLDARIARRTCGSLLIRAGLSDEEVAAVLGDTPEMVREHYAEIRSEEVDRSAAGI